MGSDTVLVKTYGECPEDVNSRDLQWGGESARVDSGRLPTACPSPLHPALSHILMYIFHLM